MSYEAGRSWVTSHEGRECVRPFLHFEGTPITQRGKALLDLQEEEETGYSEVLFETSHTPAIQQRILRQYSVVDEEGPTNRQETVDFLLEDQEPRHPPENQKTFQIKSGCYLKPIGVTLEIGGKASLVAGAASATAGLLSGVTLMVPGLALAGTGAGSLLLGKKLQRKAKGREEELYYRLEGLPKESRDHLAKKVEAWASGKKGSASFQRVRFEILEQEIKHSAEINQKEKITLLQKFTGRKTGQKEYRALFKKFVHVKAIHAQAPQDLKKMLPHLKEEQLGAKVERLLNPDKSKDKLNLATKVDRERFFGSLIDFVLKNGDYSQREIIKQGHRAGLTQEKIWQNLTSSIPEIIEFTFKAERLDDFEKTGEFTSHDPHKDMLVGEPTLRKILTQTIGLFSSETTRYDVIGSSLEEYDVL